MAPKGDGSCALLLAKADSEHQASRIGDQTGGRVFLFLYTDDFERDYMAYQKAGVTFVRPPREEVYGKVAVFEDLYGNRWDLLEPKAYMSPKKIFKLQAKDFFGVTTRERV